MFSGCSKINMEIESETTGDIVFDYLFHWPTSITVRTIDASIY
jgi:hypothetical protein